MDAVAVSNTFTISVDRTTRKITIASDTTTFDLLISSGSQSTTSPFSLLGFTGSLDLTGSMSYTGDSGAGSEFQPQFILQDFTDSENFQETIDATVNESASGEIEVVGFGTRKFIEFSLKFISDLAQDGKVIKNNPNGVLNAQQFMQDLVQKNPVEFMPDISDRATFKKLLLESTRTARDGTGYKLEELTRQNLPGYFEINNLRFRVLS